MDETQFHQGPPDDERARLALRRAAELGPGYRGVRRPGSLAERASLLESLGELEIEPPPYLENPRLWIDRRAKLFAAGAYPDKGLTVTAAHLAKLAEGFDLPVPVLIEHAESPLELGYLTQVVAEGDELTGILAFSKEANDLIEQSGAYSLSLGVTSDLDRIVEVSLVRTPRVKGARLLGAASGVTRWSQPLPTVRDAIRRDLVRAAVANAVSAGRLVPAQVAFAETLLACDDVVRFGEAETPVAALVQGLIDRAPAHGLFSERAPDPERDLGEPMGPEEAAFYERYFPGLSLGEISRRRGAGPASA